MRLGLGVHLIVPPDAVLQVVRGKVLCGESGVEIRIQTEAEHRVFYVVTFAEAVYVVHAFEKRTRKTPPHELKLARDRYRALIKERRADDAKNN